MSTEASSTPVGDDGEARVVLLTRAQCPTCVRMEDVVRRVCDEVGQRWTVVDVAAPGADPELRAEYADVVPVTLVDGREIASWSLEWNFGPGHEDAFWAGYGEAPDPERIRRYRTLWDA